MSWTDERIERLKKMWHDGATASQIADELGGVSRNAVIGKAHRLGLEQRPSPVKPGEEKEAKKAGAAAAPRAKPAGAQAPKPGQGRAAAPRRRRRSGRAARARPAAAPPGAGDAVSLDRPRRLHPPGSGRPAGADPARAAAPPGAGQAEPRGRRQDQPARSQRPHLQMADRPPRRARLPFLRRSRRTPASLIASQHCGVAYQAQLPRRDRRPPPPLPFGGPQGALKRSSRADRHARGSSSEACNSGIIARSARAPAAGRGGRKRIPIRIGEMLSIVALASNSTTAPSAAIRNPPRNSRAGMRLRTARSVSTTDKSNACRGRSSMRRSSSRSSALPSISRLRSRPWIFHPSDTIMWRKMIERPNTQIRNLR